jgi:MoxR-like ATPase
MLTGPVWFVRAGQDNKYAAEFRLEGFVAIGWKRLGQLPTDISEDGLVTLLATHYPTESPSTRQTWSTEILQYIAEIHPGDWVVTYDPTERAYFVGKVTSELQWADHELARHRKVEWTARADRDVLSRDAQNALGRPLTVFRANAEAVSELNNLAEDLHGDLDLSAALSGKAPGAFVSEDFEVLKRNPRSVPWGELTGDDRAAIKSLRQKLLRYATYLKDKVVAEVELKPFASHPNPSGRNAQHYWACVYPEQARNKAFAFQLFVIVTGEYVEYGFGLGSGTAEMRDTERLQALTREFEIRRESLRELKDDSGVQELGGEGISAGFRLRARWVHSAEDVPQYSTVSDWIEHATGGEGGGAAISKVLTRAEAIATGAALSHKILSELQPFAPLLDRIYGRSPLPTNTTSRAETETPAIIQQTVTLDWLQEATLWPKSALEQILESLASRTPQVVLAGPPGTGKTWVAEAIARYITQAAPDAVKTIQFHPSYTYEEFVEGLRPALNGGALQFARVDGVMRKVVDGLTSDDPPRVLVIDEMNRANLPRVFGELMYLLEYRDQPIDLQYSVGFALPSTLGIIGTMNTADRNIRSIDVALRRRFDFFDCPPDPTILERYFHASGRSNEVSDLIAGFVALNERLTKQLDRHHTIGHAFFMNTPFTAQRLRRLWKHKLQPLLEEYFFDQPELLKEFAPKQFWKIFNDAD